WDPRLHWPDDRDALTCGRWSRGYAGGLDSRSISPSSPSPAPEIGMILRNRRLVYRETMARSMSKLARTMFGVTLLTVGLQADVVNFDTAATGQPPPGWTATFTGSGEARWTIESDGTAPSKPNVLKQSGDATYSICFENDTSLRDGFVEVKFN